MDKKKLPSAKKPLSGMRPASKGRGKSATKRPRKVAEPYVSKFPPIDFEKINEIPEVSMTVRLDQMRTEGYFFDLKLPINMTFRKVIEKINERHGNSCHNIRIFLSDKKPLDNFIYRTFKELGIKPGENFTLYYEYEPAIHPLLEAGLV